MSQIQAYFVFKRNDEYHFFVRDGFRFFTSVFIKYERLNGIKFIRAKAALREMFSPRMGKASTKFISARMLGDTDDVAIIIDISNIDCKDLRSFLIKHEDSYKHTAQIRNMFVSKAELAKISPYFAPNFKRVVDAVCRL